MLFGGDCALHSSRKVYIHKLFLNCIGKLTDQCCWICVIGCCSYTLTSCSWFVCLFLFREMANSNANGSTNSNVNGSAKAGLPGDMDGMEDSVEFRLMMAYAQRRRPREVLCPLPQGTDTQPGGAQTLEGHADTFIKKEKKRKKKGIRRRLQSLLSCIRPHRDSTAVASGPPRTPSPPTGTQRSSFRSFGNCEFVSGEGETGGLFDCMCWCNTLFLTF